MSRLIDADALIKEITEVRCVNCDRRKGMKKGKMTFVYEIGEVPCRACDVMDMIDVLDEATTVGGWISVKDRLPENAEHLGSFCPRYQVMTKYGTTEGWYNPDKGCWYTLVWFLIGRFDEEDIYMERGDIPRISKKIEVTHWMPLPEPPKEVSGDA